MRRRRSSSVVTPADVVDAFSRDCALRTHKAVLKGSVMGKVTVRAITPGSFDEDPYSEDPAENHSRSRKAPVNSGTLKRIIPYMKPHKWTFLLLVVAGLMNALAVAASPVMLGVVIDKGITPKKMDVIVAVAMAIVALAVLESGSQYLRARCSARIGQGLIYQLRTQVFEHVQEQSVAFFTRSQTGSLVSRLNTDVMVLSRRRRRCCPRLSGPS
jgi:ATP-binding cassette subfamily B protein